MKSFSSLQHAIGLSVDFNRLLRRSIEIGQCEKGRILVDITPFGDQFPVQLIREALPENRTRKLLFRCQLPQETNIIFIVKFSFSSWDNLNSSIIQQLGKYILDVCSVNVTYRCEGVSQEGQCYKKPSHDEITFLWAIR